MFSVVFLLVKGSVFMTKIITTDNGQQYQTAGGWKTFGAIMAGSAASSVASAASLGIALPCMNKMKKCSESSDTVQLRSAIQKTFNKTSLPAKGVELIDIATPSKASGLYSIDNIVKLITDPKTTLTDLHPENKKLAEAITNELPKWQRGLPQTSVRAELITSMLENGDNACYLPKGKKVIVNIEKLGLSAFHEMGHAINHNCTKFWKGMQKLRGPMQITAGLLATTALFKRKKVEGEQPKNVFDKATTFIKNNVGKLVTLAFVPIVAEELMATRRGNKMAAKVLPLELLKKVKTSNRLGALTYVASSILAGAGAYLASKVRDKIAQPKEI